jgi:hypothetical protein
MVKMASAGYELGSGVNNVSELPPADGRSSKAAKLRIGSVLQAVMV